MITMDTRGQISVEFILFLALVLLVVLAFAYFISDQSEQNNIATATRLGAQNATTAMGITTPGMIPVRVDGIQMNGNQNITIIINLSYSSPQIQNTTLTGVYNALTSLGYTLTQNKDSSPEKYIQNLTLNTTKHNYTIQVTS